MNSSSAKFNPLPPLFFCKHYVDDRLDDPAYSHYVILPAYDGRCLHPDYYDLELADQALCQECPSFEPGEGYIRCDICQQIKKVNSYQILAFLNDKKEVESICCSYNCLRESDELLPNLGVEENIIKTECFVCDRKMEVDLNQPHFSVSTMDSMGEKRHYFCSQECIEEMLRAHGRL